ncbi:hypothetical protein NEUTE2DRAFT_50064, partial [Neurospora tetrasperma FGSC 2509]
AISKAGNFVQSGCDGCSCLNDEFAPSRPPPFLPRFDSFPQCINHSVFIRRYVRATISILGKWFTVAILYQQRPTVWPPHYRIQSSKRHEPRFRTRWLDEVSENLLKPFSIKTRYQRASSFHWDLAVTGGQKVASKRLDVNGWNQPFGKDPLFLVKEIFSLVHPICCLYIVVFLTAS